MATQKENPSKNDLVMHGMELVAKTVLDMCKAGEEREDPPEKIYWRIKNYVIKLFSELG